MENSQKRPLKIVVTDVTPANYIVKMLGLLNRYFTTEVVAEQNCAARDMFEKCGITARVSAGNNHAALLVGCSTDSSSEASALAGLMQLSPIPPSVAICDMRGAHLRHGLIEAEHFIVPSVWAAGDIPKERCFVCGDVNALPLPDPTEEMRKMVRAFAGTSEVVVWVAEKDVESLEIILRCLKPEQKLILGLHPDPEKWPDPDRIESLIRSLEWRATMATRIHPELNTMQAIACLDPEKTVVTASISGGATMAAVNGYRVALVDNPTQQDNYARYCPPGGILPLEALIGSPVIHYGREQDLFTLDYPSQEVIDENIKPFDALETAQYLVEVLR